jgi:hypothetical protein
MVGRTAIDSQADRLYVEVLRLALQIRNGLVPNLHLRVRGVARPAGLRPNVGVNDDRLGSSVVMLGDGSDGFVAGDLGGVGGS